jgi:long-chain acyl-CoA synthetase
VTSSRDDAIAGLTGPGGPFEIVEEGQLRTWAKGPGSLRDLLEGTRRLADRDYLVYGDERWTHTEHLGLVAGLARWLATERGIGKGDRVAIGMRNYPEWIITFWATQALGAVVVPLNAWWTAPELRFALEDSGASVVVVDGERHDRMVADLTDLGLPSIVVRHDGELGGGAVAWADVLDALDRSAPMPTVAIDPDDVATIVYTSGTTGRSKGAVGSHRNHVSTFLNTAFNGTLGSAMARAAGAPKPEPPAHPACALQTYPFFHIGGINALCINTGFGVKVVLQYKWDLDEVLDTIERERVTSLAAVPTLLRELLESPKAAERDLSSLGTVASGGAPVPPDLVGRIDARGASPSNGYGLTETTGAVTLNVGRDYVANATSVGIPFPVIDARVVDPATHVDLPVGEVGELWFRGPTVCRGYWQNPEATAQAFTDGWFHTGDLGHLDDAGYVYVVDRLKDVIIRGGENVYCAEVEAALFEHPAVADVAVVGVPHAELGEEVAAVVLLKDGADVAPTDLQAHVAERLAYFKVPAHVVVRTEELPRNATGKVLKRELRDELASASGPGLPGDHGAQGAGEERPDRTA